MNNTPVQKRKRPSLWRANRVTRFWLRYQGRIYRFIAVTFYTPETERDGGIGYTKRISHRRWTRGWHWGRGEYDEGTARWFAELPLDQWVE